MRVLGIGSVYPPHFLGGHELLWAAVDRALLAQGDEPRALVSDHRSAAAGDAADPPWVARELRWYWRAHAWPRIGWRERISLERHNAHVLAAELATHPPDVAAFWPMGGMSLSLVEQVRRAGIPALLFVHDYWLAYGAIRDRWTAAFRGRPLLGGLAARLTGVPATVDWQRAGRYLFNSTTVREHAAGLDLGELDAAVLSPGVERELFAPAEPQPWRWRLLAPGRIVEQKGIDTAVAALAELPQDAELVIAGEGEDELVAQLRAQAGDAGVAARVRFEPARPHAAMRELYAAADAVLFPVRWDEPWGLVPLEAMAVGRPVVATGRGGSGDYLRHERNCLLFEPGDANGLAAAVRRLADDDALRTSLRAGGSATAAEHDAERFVAGAIAELRRAAGLSG